MKKKIMMMLVVTTLFSSLLLFSGGCSKKTVIPPDSAGGGRQGSAGGTDINYPLAEGGYSQDNLPADGTLDDASGQGGAYNAALDQQSDEYKRLHGRSSEGLYPIYFDYDQAGVRPDMTDILINNSDYLNSVPHIMVIVEGNSDERGTNEYNLALGERRAINTQQYLINLGVDPNRIRTISYGEERPLFFGQDEFTYSQNRRVDFVIE